MPAKHSLRGLRGIGARCSRASARATRGRESVAGARASRPGTEAHAGKEVDGAALDQWQGSAPRFSSWTRAASFRRRTDVGCCARLPFSRPREQVRIGAGTMRFHYLPARGPLALQLLSGRARPSFDRRLTFSRCPPASAHDAELRVPHAACLHIEKQPAFATRRDAISNREAAAGSPTSRAPVTTLPAPPCRRCQTSTSHSWCSAA